MLTAFESDKGKVRAHNEDAGGVFLNTAASTCLVLVADGMGGHQAGDVASRMTVEGLEHAWQSAEFSTSEEAKNWLIQTIEEVNEHLLQYSKSHDECKGMGTTIVSAICTEEYVVVAHIGDSRCYIKNQYDFKQITSDHSLVNELVRSGQISAEDAENHPRKNVLMRALGTEEGVIVDVKTLTWEEGDLILLCSDGLTNKVSDEDMHEILASNLSLHEQAAQLTAMANEGGGEDNITVAVVQHQGRERGSE
ncbi:Stp1/IreP family PP2C-type Ser/Thr phosphatase [Bacillus solimangrovi]|uniref:protein-serine/threonine phosphatase n=1 Tax=Bacillus solimangrovi TaxID=1305675 RepID=A0A1E5LAU6_9BACI|nr:Stp1/IreP family PP2C-type Ser/Thr phosphatase [Bacillus solimangrovi]OEH91215.1 protein phosphatase [Bacillus solimangrovi]